MPLRWIDPHVQKSLALAAVVLAITGLLLTGRSSRAARVGPLDDGPRPTRDDRRDDEHREPTASFATFGGDGLRGRLALGQSKVLEGGRRSVFVELRATADEADEPRRGRRAPVALVLAVDTSGSMAGRKLSEAQRAASALLAEMRDDDSVALVRFASDARLLVPLAPVGEVRARAQREIEALSAGGDTNIARAIKVSVDELASRGARRVKRVALVTDGRDTSGSPRDTAASLARRESGRGTTVSTLGIGTDYDDGYLADLAAAGHGNYEYLGDGSAMARFLSRELQETAQTTVEQVALELTLPRGARVREVWGGTSETTRDGVRVALGSLFTGDERRVLLSVEVDAGDAGSSQAIGAEMAWVPVGGAGDRVVRALSALRLTAASSAREVEASRDPAVVASVTSVSASQREREAASAFERGDATRALALNRQSREELEAEAQAAPAADAARLRAQSNAYGADARSYASPPSAPAAAASAARPIMARENKNLARDMAY